MIKQTIRLTTERLAIPSSFYIPRSMLSNLSTGEFVRTRLKQTASNVYFTRQTKCGQIIDNIGLPSPSPPPCRIDCSCRLRLEASRKGGVFVLFWETYTFIYIRLIRTSLNRSRALKSPACYSSAATRGRERRYERQWLHFCLFVCFFFHLGVYRVLCVSFYSLYRQSKLCPTKKLHIFILFFCFLFAFLKFSKTPFHVVLSKNKTNTKKKISFLIINFCFFSQFTVFFNSVHKWTCPHQKLTALVCVCSFLGGFHFGFFFNLFFSIFFHYFVTKIYFFSSALCYLAHEFFLLSSAILSFPFRANSCLVSFADARAHTHTFHINDWF